MNYVDLLVTDDDLTLGVTGEPQTISDRQSIAQDIKHLVRESGLLVVMIAERDRKTINLNLVRIENLIENDVRIKPGTARVTFREGEALFIQARTNEYGPIEVYL